MNLDALIWPYIERAMGIAEAETHTDYSSYTDDSTVPPRQRTLGLVALADVDDDDAYSAPRHRSLASEATEAASSSQT
jgi:hypothetical protein